MLQRKKSDRVIMHLSPLLNKMGVVHAFFERNGGVSPEPYASLNFSYGIGDDRTHVDLNYQTAFSALEINPDTHARVDVVNKDQLAIEPEFGSVSGVDAVIFTQGSASIAVADCSPVMIVHQDPDVYALVHAGWFGTTRRIVEKTMQELVDRYKIDPADCVAVIGPTIGQKNYEIQDDVAGEIKGRLPEYMDDVLTQKEEQILFDIPGAIYLQLQRMGVTQIDVSYTDVYEDENFFSHRREGKPTGRNGIFLSFPQDD